METSVVSYYTARSSRDVIILAHQELTREWWTLAIGRFALCVSQAVIEESERGDPDAASGRLAAIHGFAILPITDEVESLASIYQRELDIPDICAADALHLSVASVHGTDYLVTWNCKHIANAEIRRHLAQINTEENVSTPIICTPEELMGR